MVTARGDGTARLPIHEEREGTVMKSKKRRQSLHAGLATLLVLLLVGTATSVAQDEAFDNPPPQIDPTPVILSRTVTDNEINTVVELPISQDTYITSNRPDDNWCTSNWLRIGYSLDPPNYGAVRMFLKFDLSSIPQEAAINSAQFRIYMHSATPPGDSEMRVESRHLLTDWNQCLITWNNHQPQWGPVFGSSWLGTTTGWLTVDATDLVRDWVYGIRANYGAMVMGDETVRERQRLFYSSRDTGGRYPRMIVDYTLHVDNEPPVVNVNALPAWSPQRFIVSWSGYDPGGSGIAYYDIQYRPPAHDWIDWLPHTQATSAEFVGGANGLVYEFRARGVDNAGNVQPWNPTAQAWTKIDSIAPTAIVNALDPIIYSPNFIVSWTGSDNDGGSGIAGFDVQIQADGGAWYDWLIGTSSLYAEVTGAQNGVTYGFRARATDVAGNVQPWSLTAQAATLVNTQGPVAWIVPFEPPKTDADKFLVRWVGESSPTTPIVGYDVRYRFRDSAWIPWLSNTLLTDALFTDVREEDGIYCFSVRATDSAGRTSAYARERCIVVDRYAPYLQPEAYMPAAYKNASP
jgi:hypothetical protein